MKKLLYVALSLALTFGTAAAQWQVPQNAVPVGKGGGNQGFDAAPPTATGDTLTSNGPTAKPSFQPAGGAYPTYATKTAAAAATVPASVLRIRTLGYTTANDNGGAGYIRTATAGDTAYRFHSADGQGWTLDENTVTPEMFGCFGSGADCTAALQVMSTWMTTIAPDGVTYSGKPGAAYLIWSNAIVTPTPSFLFNLNRANGHTTFNFNGSYFTTDNLFASGVRVVFLLTGGQSFTFNDPKYVQSAYTTPLDQNKGAQLITLVGDLPSPFTGNVIVNNAVQDGGTLGFNCTNGAVAFNPNPTNGQLQINNYKVSNVYYPLSFQNCGDNFTAKGVLASNVGRLYFPYNVSMHDVEAIGDGGGPFDQLLLKSYADPRLTVAKRGLQDIHVKYRNAGRISAVASGSIASLEFQQTVANPTVSGVVNNGSGLFRLTVNSTANMVTGQTWYVNNLGGNPGSINGLSFVVTVVDGTHIDLVGSTFAAGYTAGGYLAVPSHMKNITVDLDIDDTNGNGQPTAAVTRKFNSAAGTEVLGQGYFMDNVRIGGVLRNYNAGGSVLDLFGNTGGFGSVGVWAGDYITNFTLRDLVIKGSNGTVLIDTTNLNGNFVAENVYCSTGITPTVTGSSNTKYRPRNVTCGSLTDTVIPASLVTGTINGGGNQLNNIIIGTSTPLAGTFTTAIANTSVQTPIVKSNGSLVFQVNGATQAGIISSAGKWLVGLNTTVSSLPRFAINDNVAATIPNSAITNSFSLIGADDASAGIVIQGWSNSFAFISPTFSTQRSRGTAASPTKVLSGDTLYQSVWQGCYGAGTCVPNAAGNNAGAGLYVKTTEDWNDSTHNGTIISFLTTSTASGTPGFTMSIQNSVMAGTQTDGAVGQFIMNEATYLMRNRTAWTNNAAAAAGTLNNAPAAGNPTKWIRIDDNGTSRFIPAW